MLFLLLAMFVEANPVGQMLERLQKGLSSRFKIEIHSSSDQGDDYFELYGGGRKVTVRANNYVSAGACEKVAGALCRKRDHGKNKNGRGDV